MEEEKAEMKVRKAEKEVKAAEKEMARAKRAKLQADEAFKKNPSQKTGDEKAAAGAAKMAAAQRVQESHRALGEATRRTRLSEATRRARLSAREATRERLSRGGAPWAERF